MTMQSRNIKWHTEVLCSFTATAMLLMAELDELETQLLCAACEVGIPRVLLQPCGHMLCCGQVNIGQQCPVCGTHISEVLHMDQDLTFH